MASPATPWQPTSKFPVSAFPSGSGVTPYSNRPIPVAGTSSAGTVAPIKTRTTALNGEGPRRGGRKTNNSLSTDHKPEESSSKAHPLASSSTLPDFSKYEGLATSTSTGPLIKTLLSSFAILTDEIAALRGEVRALRQGEAGSLGAGIFKDLPPSLEAWRLADHTAGANGNPEAKTSAGEPAEDDNQSSAKSKGKQKETDEEISKTSAREPSSDGPAD